MTDLSTSNLKRLLAEERRSLPEMRWTYKGAAASSIRHDYPSKHEEMYGVKAELKVSPLDQALAEEVIRLRAGVEQILEMCLLERDAAFQDSPMRAGEVVAFNLCAERLTNLLEAHNLGAQDG